MKNNKKSFSLILKKISSDRERTNILRNSEQQSLTYLVQRVPSWLTSDGLTAIGLVGNISIGVCLVLARYVSDVYLLIGLLGFIVNWYGDSLDGRLAYYRNIPRKWYGFSLDVTVDWVGLSLVGVGFYIYAIPQWKWLGLAFIVLYGWEMITSQLRYKVTGKYSIDSGIFGPTELRIILMAILTAEFFFRGSVYYSVSIACLILVATNIIDMVKLLKAADSRDIVERKKKQKKLNLKTK